MLTGAEIKKKVESGDIVIEPFDLKQVNPNSYDVRLGNTLGIYKDSILDAKKHNEIELFEIPNDGFVLQPNEIYLGFTVESTYTPFHIAVITGKSSTGRLGIDIHKTASLGDIGFSGHWVLEITVTKPVRIYANMPFAQICFHEAIGEIKHLYNGKYQNQNGVIESMHFKNFE